MSQGPFGPMNPPADPSLIEELLAKMPEEAQEHVAELMLEAQVRLLEQYIEEI